MNDVAPTGGSRRWVSLSSCGGAIALASALLMGGSAPALAEPPPPASADNVWGGCVLNSGVGGTLEGLIGDITADVGIDSESPNVEIAFVVVYAVNNDNDGQPLAGEGGGFTGPIICRNDEVVGIETTTQDAEIPADSTGATSVDTLDLEDVFILRYALRNAEDTEEATGPIEKVICHTVDSNVNCFRIFPLLIEGGD